MVALPEAGRVGVGEPRGSEAKPGAWQIVAKAASTLLVIATGIVIFPFILPGMLLYAVFVRLPLDAVKWWQERDLRREVKRLMAEPPPTDAELRRWAYDVLERELCGQERVKGLTVAEFLEARRRGGPDRLYYGMALWVFMSVLLREKDPDVYFSFSHGLHGWDVWRWAYNDLERELCGDVRVYGITLAEFLDIRRKIGPDPLIKGRTLAEFMSVLLHEKEHREYCEKMGLNDEYGEY